jgi:hypothetical protein
MDSFSFWILPAIVAIIASAFVSVTNIRARRHASSNELAKRVEELERRVSSIEKNS